MRLFHPAPRVSRLTETIIGASRARSLSAPTREVLSEGVKRLNSLVGPEYPALDVSYRPNKTTTDVSEKEGCLCLYASGTCMPPVNELMVIGSDGISLFLPGRDNKDFVSVINQLKLTSPLQVVLLDAIITKRYGVCEKNTAPSHIMTPEDVISRGIKLDTVDLGLDRFQDERNSLWWQPWGGVLFSLELDLSLGLCQFTHHGFDEGHYQRLPIRLFR